MEEKINFVDGMSTWELGVKRCSDFCGALLLLIIFLPLILFIWISLWFEHEGSPVFKQERIGYKGKPFYIYKFRTMRKDAENGVPQLAQVHDKRLTSLGRFLREHHLDELPQMWNVLVGDMSLVGPRPEVRHYVNYWTTEQMHVLDVRPGITDPASIKFRNENELLAQAEDPEKYYIEVIMQEKIKSYLDYVEKNNFWYDNNRIEYKIDGVGKKDKNEKKNSNCTRGECFR